MRKNKSGMTRNQRKRLKAARAANNPHPLYGRPTKKAATEEVEEKETRPKKVAMVGPRGRTGMMAAIIGLLGIGR